MDKVKRLRNNVLLSIVTIAVCIIIIEALSFAVLSVRPIDPLVINASLYVNEMDGELGYVNRASAEHTVETRTESGRLCYSATYHTDALGRRVTTRGTGSEHVILFGDSVVFGEGLQDNETLSEQLAQLLPDKQVFNYGVSGYGPQNVLTKLRQGTIANETTQRGVALFVLIPPHVDRARGTTLTPWLYDDPYYELEDGALVHVGTMQEALPVRTAFYNAFNALKRHSQFLTLTDARIPLRMSEEDFERTAALLAAAKESYESQVNGSFIVLFHPGWNHTKPYHGHERLLALLGDKNVTVWDYSGFLYLDEKHTFVCDPHPNAAFNREFASILARRLA